MGFTGVLTKKTNILTNLNNWAHLKNAQGFQRGKVYLLVNTTKGVTPGANETTEQTSKSNKRVLKYSTGEKENKE